MFVTEYADRSGIQGEMLAFLYRQTNPTRRERTQKLSMRKQGYGSVHRPKRGNYSVCAFRKIPDRFALRRTILKHAPAWMLRADLGSCPAFIVAIIQLVQVRIYPGDSTKTRQLAGPPRTLEGAG